VPDAVGGLLGRTSLEPGMDSFEMNKIAGAILFTLTMTLGLGILAEIVFEQHAPEKPGYELADASPAPDATAAPAAVQEEPLGVLLASASLEKGQAQFKKCAGCHTIEKGAKNGTGPNLFGVLGGPVAHRTDFAYSPALKALHDEGRTWTLDDFNKFIASPQGYAKGTKMSFAGLPKSQDRADLILYVRSMADSPVALPAADTPVDAGVAKPENETTTTPSAGSSSTPTP
jgi:cytochrome c